MSDNFACSILVYRVGMDRNGLQPWRIIQHSNTDSDKHRNSHQHKHAHGDTFANFNLNCFTDRYRDCNFYTYINCHADNSTASPN